MTSTSTSAVRVTWCEELATLAADLGPGLFVAAVLHDDACPFLNGRGLCNCDFDIEVRRVAPLPAGGGA
jgi:hypothetical protein